MWTLHSRGLLRRTEPGVGLSSLETASGRLHWPHHWPVRHQGFGTHTCALMAVMETRRAGQGSGEAATVHREGLGLRLEQLCSLVSSWAEQGR